MVDRPRLATHVRVFDCEDGLAVRTSKRTMFVPADRQNVVRKLLSGANGSRTVDALLDGESAPDSFFALHFLDQLEQLGMLGNDGPDPISIEPDLAAIEAMNARAIREGQRFVPIWALGEELIVGPWVEPGASACFECFLLRWLGVASASAAERAYFDRLRKNGAAHELPEPARARAEDLLERWIARGDRAGWVAIGPLEGGELIESLVARHPRCAVCRHLNPPRVRPLRPSDFDDAPRPLLEMRRILDPFAAARVGFVELFPPEGRAARLPPHLPVAIAGRFSVPEPTRARAKDKPNTVLGTAADTASAEAIALIEALERYAGMMPASSTTVASFESVRDRALDPNELPLFSEAQYQLPEFPFRRFDPSRPIEWVTALDLGSEGDVLVPAVAVHYGRREDFVFESSSGIAAHSSRASALLNGILELIERDAFMIHWLHRLTPPLFELESSGDPEALALKAYVESEGYQVRIADLTTDLAIPVAAAFAVRTDKKLPALLLGAGCAMDPVLAVKKALRELLTMLLLQPDGWFAGRPRRVDEVQIIHDHAMAYSHPSWLEHASFLWAGPTTALPRSRATEGDRADLAQAIARIFACGHRVLVAEITTADIAPFGLFVMRAIVPGLQPISFGQYLRLGGRRLYEAPVRMGRSSSPPSEASLNPIPHCFP